MEGTEWTLACARDYAAGACGVGRQRGRVAGDAALPPQDPEEEVPLRCACALCATGGCGGVLCEYIDSALGFAVSPKFCIFVMLYYA